MPSKKILLVGDSNSIFVYDFAHQYISRGSTVDIISTTKNTKSISVNNLEECVYPSKSFWGGLARKVNYTFSFFTKLNKLDTNYDAIIIHYANYHLAWPSTLLKMRTSKLITVIWGSDFYQTSKKNKKKQQTIYHNSSTIVFTNPKTLEAFNKEFVLPKTKRSLARFGLPAFDFIDKHIEGNLARKEMLSEFSLPDKTIIMIGYSASNSHKQCEIIKTLSELPEDVRSRVHLVFPLGYGSQNLSSEIENTLAQHYHGSHTILKKFYNPNTVAKLRLVTNILINLQASDQFSGSMQETLYAGGITIAGAWLPYQELIARGAKIISVESMMDINSIITALVNPEDPLSPNNEKELQDFKSYLKELSSWKSNIGKWNSILFSKQ